MLVRNILIAIVVIGVAVCGAVTMVPQGDNADGGKSLVTHRPLGVAYAQEGQGGGGSAPPPGGAPPPAAGDPAAGGAPAADAAAAPAVEELSDEEWLAKLEEWKNTDPREIVEKKYDDLNSKKTDPSNEDNPEGFIPETGRVDPLTVVRSVMPKELVPPRSGESDGNEIETYLDAQIATAMVDGLGSQIEVYNVIQIGLEKIVSVLIGDQGYAINEGESFSTYLFSPEGRPVQIQFTMASVSSDEVVIAITATPYESNVNITKEFNFIPR